MNFPSRYFSNQFHMEVLCGGRNFLNPLICDLFASYLSSKDLMQVKQKTAILQSLCHCDIDSYKIPVKNVDVRKILLQNI